MPTEITYADGVAELPPAIEADIAAAVAATLTGLGAGDAVVSLHIADDALLHSLNSAYRGTDRPTDVLSFLLAGDGDPADAVGPLGDVVISRERAAAQAEQFGHSERRELCYLAVHGTLHLLGFDDEDAAGAAVMAERAEAVLTALGVPRL